MLDVSFYKTNGQYQYVDLIEGFVSQAIAIDRNVFSREILAHLSFEYHKPNNFSSLH